MGVTVKKCHIIMSGNDCWNIVYISIAAEKATTIWPTWHCQAACSRTVLLRPETLDRRRLTAWTAESANGSIWQSEVLADQARRRHGHIKVCQGYRVKVEVTATKSVFCVSWSCSREVWLRLKGRIVIATIFANWNPHSTVNSRDSVCSER